MPRKGVLIDFVHRQRGQRFILVQMGVLSVDLRRDNPAQRTDYGAGRQRRMQAHSDRQNLRLA